MMTIRPSHRRLQSRLAELALSTAPVGYSTDPSGVDENFVARLQSLAIASSIAPAPRSTRIRKQVGAVIGAVGILGWAGAAAAGAGVGLAATGNLPAPVQEVVADVLDVVKISVPRPDPLPVPEVPLPTDGGSEDQPELENSDSQEQTNETGPIETTTTAVPVQPSISTSTTSSTTTTSTPPVASDDDRTPETIVACGTPAAASNPNCFERIDEDTIEIIPVDTVCDAPAAANNSKCLEEAGDNDSTIPACDTPAAANNPNCFEEADEGAIVVVPSCDNSTA
ncbi:MAG: hypothetical protein ACPHHT_10430, partial [Ilumatobacteraceae bacterium]